MMETDNWVRVDERLPERHKLVWCYDQAEATVTTGYHSVDGWWQDGEYELYNVTHWQPLIKPKPPNWSGGSE